MSKSNVVRPNVFQPTLWLRCCLGVSLCSFFSLVSCGPDEQTSRSRHSGTVSSSKAVGSTTLSHGGPTSLASRKGIGAEDSRIGQRVKVRSLVGDKEPAPLSLLPELPGISRSEVAPKDGSEQTVLPGSMVTVVGIASDSSYNRMTQQSKVPVERTGLFIKIEREDGVQGWLPGRYLAFQNTRIRE